MMGRGWLEDARSQRGFDCCLLNSAWYQAGIVSKLVRFRSWRNNPGDTWEYFVARTKVLFYVSHVKFP